MIVNKSVEISRHMLQTHILQDLGLSVQEAAAYVSLLRHPGSRASVIARDIGIKRTTIYDILSSLVRKGFATTYFKKTQRIYFPQKPSRIAHVYEKKLGAFTQIIPQLASLERQETPSMGLRLIQTRQELEAFHLQIISDYARQGYDVIGDARGWLDAFSPGFVERFRRDRARAKIRTRLLLSAGSQSLEPSDAKLLRETRFLPTDLSFESSIYIFPDKILVASPHFSSLAVVIEIPAMADVFQTVFEVLWVANPPSSKRSRQT